MAKFEHEGMVLWYGTEDAPAPADTVAEGASQSVIIGIQPPGASYRIVIRYRLNQGPVKTIPAAWLRNDHTNQAQYFEAQFPAFRSGDIVEYTPVCNCVGRQVPYLKEPIEFLSSFRVIKADVEHIPKATAALLDMPVADTAAAGVISTSSADPARGAEAAPPSGFERSAARQSAAPVTGAHPAEAQLATESLSGATPALSITAARELPERLANVARLEGALASPSTGATTLQPASAAPTEMPVAALSAEMNVEEKKSAMVINEGATAGPFVMAIAPFLIPPVLMHPQPEPKPLIIKGEFAIFTFDKDLNISWRDFQFYELSAEISGLPNGAFQVLRCAFTDDLCVKCIEVDLSVNCPTGWSEGDLGAGTDRKKYLYYTQFQFPEGPCIVKPGTTATVRVIVKSFEGVRVWSNEYKADYPRLHDNLQIEVPLQRPITRTSATKRPKSTNDKKLRGQVLELSKKCNLKDLIVVIQAKARGDKLWRIVSAGRTDSAGNFSLPYPFGVFDEAQALVSVTPNSPATVKVTDNETISEDFLYLLIKDIEYPQDEGEADCDCNGKRRPARLPDQSDLIGSDEYTQDIGGSCINLSTPNRTLSEFNYQAIVRTSDPDVANYTFKKVEETKPAGLDPVHMLEISRALSTLESVLRNLTFQNALPPAVSSAELLAQIVALRAHIEKAPNADVNAAIKSVDLLISDLIPSTARSDTNSGSALAQGSSVSAATIETEISRVIAEVKSQPPPFVLGGEQLSWDTLEGAIRQAVINAGGGPLTPTFFFQFGGWRAGEVANLDPALLSRVIGKASEAGAGGATALSGAGASALPMQNANAVNYVIGLANDLKAYLNAAQLLRRETRYELVPDAKKQKRLRQRVDLDNLVAWQDDEENMTLYQAVTVATGHVLHYKSEFKADGYSLGDVVYSLPLAPGQKKEIVVLDASHRLMGTESQTLSQGERLAAGIFDERTIISNLGGRIAESLRGASSANTSGISAGFGTGGQGYGGMGASGGSGGGYGGSGSAVIGIAGGVANANSSAWQDSSRNISQHFEETLRQSITQNANAYRQLNASVVTTVEEGQRYGVTSEVVANHNHCHALTIMYFEVLRHYAIFQRLSSVEECVFVPLLMTNFTTENIYKWRDVLAKSLLPMPADTYLQSLSASTPYSPQQHPLVRAFDANERILTNYANVDYPVGSYDDEPIQFIRGNLRIRVRLPRPRTRFDRIMSLPVTKQIDAQALSDAVQKFAQDSASYAAKAAFTAGIWTAFEKPPTPPDPMQYQVLATEAISDAFMSMDANFQSVPPAQCMRITNFKPQPVSFGGGQFTLNPNVGLGSLNFFAENLDDRNQWQAYADILGYSDVETMLNAYFKGNLISEWDSIFYTDIAPLVFEKIVSRISLSEFSTDFSSETSYEGGERAMLLSLTGTTSKKRNQLPLELTLAIKDQNFKKLKNYIIFNVEDLTISYFTAHYRGVLYAGNVNDDLFDDTALYIPESPDEKRNLRKEDAHLVYKLIEHLNSNIEYYNKALWYNLDPDRRYMLLDGFDIQTFNDYGLPIERRSLASVVKNELVTITGNSLVFPVAAGYRVSQSYIVEDGAEEDTGDGVEIVSLLDHYQPLTPIEPYRISVPTRGVFAEAVQGACNACEKIETDRLQDWNRFPNTDEPTAISPVTVPTPGVTDWRAAFKDFATPIVNIQNAPAAPDPGAGLAGLSELLGKSGVFKDITGLEGNQQNVIRTYLSNQENAKAFGEMAKEMAMQQHNTQNSGRIMDQITAAKNTGDISKQEAGQLVKDHLQQQIDGGATKKAELDKATREALPSVAQAGVNAINRGGTDVEATVTHPSGFLESVSVTRSALADQVTSEGPGRSGGSEANTSESLPGGVPQDGVIVPDGQSLWAGQMHETDFIRRLADELLLRLPTAPGQGEEREFLLSRIQDAIHLIKTRVVPSTQTFEDWIRERFSLPPASMTAEDFIQAVIARLDPQRLPEVIDLASRVDGLDPEEAAMRAGEYQPTSDELNSLWAAAGVPPQVLGQIVAAGECIGSCTAACGPCMALGSMTIPGSYSSDRRIGRLVHAIIQEHYLLTHPGNEIVMESFLIKGELRTSVYRLAKLATYDKFRSIIRFALWSWGRTKLPDIMDLTTHEVYEIKPRSRDAVINGVQQLCANYVCPYNAVAAILGREPVNPGDQWRPSVLYPIPPGYMVWTVTCPGMIIYDVFRLASLPSEYAGEPVYNREQVIEGSRQLSQAAATTLTVAMFALLLLLALNPELIPILLAFAFRHVALRGL
jgi:hypothetical protein